jgi:hypothetical protein
MCQLVSSQLAEISENAGIRLRRRKIWLHPQPRSTVSKLVRRHREGGNWGEGEGGAKSYDGKKTWSSINHSILSFLAPVLPILG